MVQESEQYAEEDKQKREEIETLNASDNLVYTAEKMVKDNEDKIPEDLKTEIEEKIKLSREAITEKDSEKIKLSMQDLQTTMQKVGEIVYAQPPNNDGEETPVESEEKDSDSDENTVDGEFREVK